LYPIGPARHHHPGVRALEILRQLERFAGRGAGTDAERRAARWLADQLGEDGREAAVETFWCRPDWALAHAWHAALALAGSLVAVGSPRVGGGLLVAALAAIVCDALFGLSPGRWLTPERASQNVVAPPARRAQRLLAPPRDHAASDAGEAPQPPPVRLILTANYDAGRAGLVYRDGIRRPAARLRRLARGLTPGWLGWLAVAVAWLEAVAILRVQGAEGNAISALQLPPTIAVVLALAALLELASADWSPSAGDNGSGVAVVLALARALDAVPPRNLTVEVVLTGAGDGGGIGLRRYLRSHRTECRPSTTVVIGVAACAGGGLCWWRSDGSLIPLRCARRLRDLADGVSRQEAHLAVSAHDGRGQGPALPARLARIPSLTLGCLDRDGLAPRSHQREDRSERVDELALDHAVQFGLMVIDAIDAALTQQAPPAALARV
jgi:hypothetical protein